jgi:hypothetical protein
MITHSAEGYVQDERYVAGAGMRRSDFFQIDTALQLLPPLTR